MTVPFLGGGFRFGTFGTTAPSVESDNVRKKLRSSGIRNEAVAVARPRKERPAQAKAEMLAAARELKQRAREVERAQRKLVRDRDAEVIVICAAP